MREQVLAALTAYGSPVLFCVVAIAAIGIPMPVTLLLIVAGSLAAQGVLNIWWAIVLAGAGSVIGDQIGYLIGRWGGGALVHRLAGLLGGRERLERVEAQTRYWGGAGIFFSRWLVTPLGPWVNLASGAAKYPWRRFVFWDALGECLGAAIYISLGALFSDRIMAMDSLLGDLSWGIVAVAAAVLLGWKLFSNRKPKEKYAVTA
ncbi:MAG: DedA family protein [Bryobacteraceae bacterium]